MFIELLIHRSVIDIFIGIVDGGVAYELHVVPFSFDRSSLVVGELPKTRELFAKKKSLVLAIRIGIDHFALCPDAILVLALEP
jgi:hypothetical protein